MGKLSGIVQIAAGSNGTCALSSDEKIYCWGASRDEVSRKGDRERGTTKDLQFVHQPIYVPARIHFSEESAEPASIAMSGGALKAVTKDGRLFWNGDVSAPFDKRCPPLPAECGPGKKNEEPPGDFVFYDDLAEQYPDDVELIRGTGLHAEVDSKRLVWSGISDVKQIIEQCWLSSGRQFSCLGGYGLPYRGFREDAKLPEGWHLRPVAAWWCLLRPRDELRCAAADDLLHLEFGLNQPRIALPAAPLEVWDGGGRLCAKLVDRSLVCWRESLGDRKPYEGNTPDFDRRNIDAKQVALTTESYEHVDFDICALEASGTVKCWADPHWLSVAKRHPEHAAMVETREIAGIDDGVQIVAGDTHVCVLTSAGTVKCFGENSDGQCGVGKPSKFEPQPVTVVAPRANRE